MAAAIGNTVAVYGKTSRSYNPASPPVAVLSFDDAVIQGDVAELCFERQVERAEFKFDNDFWGVVPIVFGRQRARSAYDQFTVLPRAIWKDQPSYRIYRKALVRSYQDISSRVSLKEGREYLARLWLGSTRDQAALYAQTALDEESRVKPGREIIADEAEDASPLFIRHGWRPVPEMADLARYLEAGGLEVWVIAPDFQPALEEAAARAGFLREHAIGIGLQLSRGRFTREVLLPVPVGSGKIEAVVLKTGRSPLLIVGASVDDVALLSYGKGVRVWLDGGDAAARETAVQKRWLIQRAFTP